jgi:hypothetical protein
VRRFDYSPALRLILESVRAIAESFGVHRAHHADDTLDSLRLALRQKRQMRNLGSGEQHRGRIRTCRRARAATNACGGFHRNVGRMFWNWDRIRFRRRACACGNKSSRLHNSIERAAIDYQIFDDRKTFHAKRFDHDRFAIAKFSHVKLARCAGMIRTVRFAVHVKRAGAANSFTTIRIESDRIFAGNNEPLVHDIEHLEQRSLRRNIRRIVIDELAVRLRVRLSPNSQFEIHVACGSKISGERARLARWRRRLRCRKLFLSSRL